jgi:FKBP12-rapamycin complex-associated protein
MEIAGTNGVNYIFLLKCHEDTRLDERIMQFFSLVNLLMSHSKVPLREKMLITTYQVIPVTGAVGLIGWVPDCRTVFDVVTEVRTQSRVPVELERAVLHQLAPKYESLERSEKRRIFEEVLRNCEGDELKRTLLMRATDSNHWIERRTTYATSLAATSIAGYIIGLGDRHLCNVMMKRVSAKLVHIDFGDCFEVAMRRDKFPEVVPFRLTRILQEGLEVSRIEGTFRTCCENLMEVMQQNRYQIKGLLKVFIDDPLLQWGGEAVQSKGIVKRIKDKLRGRDGDDGRTHSIKEQVEWLIQQATNISNLCVMFRGWHPWW